MKDDQRHFLALLGQPPARLTVEEAAWLINCQPHDIWSNSTPRQSDYL